MQFKRFKVKDVGGICSWIKSERALIQWAGPAFSWPMIRKQFNEHFRAARAKKPTLFPFGLYRGDTLIGYCELFAYNRKSKTAQLSRVIISPKHRNKGFAQTMIKGILEYGFRELELNRIGLGVFDFNKPAIKCYKNMGFTFEGTLREWAKVGSRYWNCHFMSILRKEWLDKKKINAVLSAPQ